MSIICFVIGYLFGVVTICLFSIGGDDDGK